MQGFSFLSDALLWIFAFEIQPLPTRSLSTGIIVAWKSLQVRGSAGFRVMGGSRVQGEGLARFQGDGKRCPLKHHIGCWVHHDTSCQQALTARKSGVEPSGSLGSFAGGSNS